MECTLIKSKNPDMEQIAAVKSLENLLLKIDYRYEDIPEYSFSKLLNLLKELKGGKLSNVEIEVLKKLISL